jgi:hypothetical protein
MLALRRSRSIITARDGDDADTDVDAAGRSPATDENAPGDALASADRREKCMRPGGRGAASPPVDADAIAGGVTLSPRSPSTHAAGDVEEGSAAGGESMRRGSTPLAPTRARAL